MPLETIDDIDDPRLDPFRDLRRTPVSSPGHFIAESWLVVERLLASRFKCESIVVTKRRYPALAANIPDYVPVFLLDDDLADRLVGYDFHNGVLARARRRPNRCAQKLFPSNDESPRTFVVVPWTSDPVNLGTIVRTCRAFGVDGLLLGPRCADPFSRRALRVSMGNALFLPIVESDDLTADVDWLKSHETQVVAAVLDDAAVPLENARRPRRMALVVGHESEGLGEEWTSRCDTAVTIPMSDGTDSLNLATATAILLYHFTRVAGGD